MMTDDLPDEVWLKILGYTSLEDRIRNIQFCCKRFHRLCADYSMTHNLDFSKAVFLPEEMCLNVVNEAKEHVSRLSFKGCHWLDSILFTDLPHLPALETLNIVCCFLEVDQILSLLQKMPKLKNLALTLSVEQMEHLRYIHENSAQILPEIHLQRLHVHMYRGDKEHVWYGYTLNDEEFNYSDWMYNVFFPDRLAECFSVEIHDKNMYYKFGKISRTVADFARYDLNDGLYADEDCEDFCRFTRKLGMHKPLVNELNVSDILELSQLKYMRLSEFRPDLSDGKCADVRPPHSLPSLEYLQCHCHFREKCVYECYDKLTQGILFDCQISSLKYLHFMAWGRPPIDVYTSISKMQNLRELVPDASYNTNLLLKSIQSLSKLESLHIPIPNENIDGRPFLEHLVSAVPRLKKFYVGIDIGDSIPHYFHSIQKSIFLENLHINIYSDGTSRELSDHIDALCTVLRNLHRLTIIRFRFFSELLISDIIHKALKFLPNLVHLTIETGDEPTQNLFKAVKECKKLEKLWIDDLKETNPIQTSTLFPLLQDVITSLPRLHLIAVCSLGFSESVKEAAKEFHMKLRKEGRKTFLYCGESWGPHLFKIPAILGPIHPRTGTWSPLPLDCF